MCVNVRGASRDNANKIRKLHQSRECTTKGCPILFRGRLAFHSEVDCHANSSAKGIEPCDQLPQDSLWCPAFRC